MAPTVHHHHHHQGTTIITLQLDHSCHPHHHRTFELLLIEIPLFAATVIVQHLGWNAKGVRNKQEGEIPVKKFKNCITDTNRDTNTNTNTDTKYKYRYKYGYKYRHKWKAEISVTKNQTLYCNA